MRGPVRQKKVRLRVPVICFLCVVLLFLLPTFFEMAMGPTGYTRSPLTDWETVRFEVLGVDLQLPKKAREDHRKYYAVVHERFEGVPGHRGSLVVMFHPIWAGGMMAEPSYQMSLHVDRQTSDSSLVSTGTLAGLGLTPQDSLLSFDKIVSGTRTRITARHPYDDNSTKVYYLRRFNAPNDDIVSASAHLRIWPSTQKHFKENNAAIEKILNSVVLYR